MRNEKIAAPSRELIERHKVDVIAFPNAWVDGLPFLTG
jgi:hypothetical protein